MQVIWRQAFVAISVSNKNLTISIRQADAARQGERASPAPSVRALKCKYKTLSQVDALSTALDPQMPARKNLITAQAHFA